MKEALDREFWIFLFVNIFTFFVLLNILSNMFWSFQLNILYNLVSINFYSIFSAKFFSISSIFHPLLMILKTPYRPSSNNTCTILCKNNKVWLLWNSFNVFNSGGDDLRKYYNNVNQFYFLIVFCNISRKQELVPPFWFYFLNKIILIP